MSVQKRHFHTFDALRFFACLKVFFQHLPIFSFPVFNVLKAGGGIGVQFFFVLSGFLITYIIFEEKQQTGELNLKKFFARRVLRIWPLFYLMIGVAFITPYLISQIHLANSDEGYTPSWWMSLLFLENYKMIVTGQNPNISPLAVMWSLCIEEHFYIVWGLLLYFIHIRMLPKVIAFCVVLSIVARAIFWHYGLPSSELLTNIDLFALGALPAYVLLQYPVWIEEKIGAIPMGMKYVFIVVLLIVVTIASQATDDKPFILLTTLLGAMFSLLIFFTLPAKGSIRISDGNVLSKLGLYTYGFYLYHTLVLNLFRRIFEKMNLPLSSIEYAVIFTILTLLLSLLCSFLSYYLFEKQFLKLKKYFR